MAAYSLYDILRTLVERVGWPSEQEKVVVLESIADAERTRVWGNMAELIVCKHERQAKDGYASPMKCLDCGRITA